MANDKEFLEFDLYLDESGNFLETSNVPAERNHPDAQQDFPSQIAGFLVPRHDIKAEARTIYERCAEAAYGQTNIRKTRTRYRLGGAETGGFHRLRSRRF